MSTASPPPAGEVLVAPQRVSGAPGGEMVGTAVTGAISSGVSAGIGFAVVGPALNATVVPAVANLSGWSAEVVRQAATLTAVGGSLGQAGYGLSQGDYSGLIGLGLTIGLTYAYAGSAAEGANGAVGAKQGRSGGQADWAKVQGEFDFASVPPSSRGELVTELVLNGRFQVEIDIARYGTPLLRNTLADFTGAGGVVELHGEALLGPRGRPDPTIFGRYYDAYRTPGSYFGPRIQIGPRAFTSFAEFQATYVHELGHGLNLADNLGPITAYDFERSQIEYITRARGL